MAVVLNNLRSLESATLIGTGFAADVYAWDEGRVLKLSHSWRKPDKVDREWRVTRALHSARLPVPATFEKIEVEGRLGIIFERVDGCSMVKWVQRKPWLLFRAARQLAELHAQLHRSRAPADLPTQRQQIEDWIREAKTLTGEETRAARHCLNQLPAGNVVCHGDFHPDNILLTARGPTIIDWSTGTQGHPAADVARTSHLLRTANLPAHVPWHMHLLLKLSRRLLHENYLNRYSHLTGTTRPEIEIWMPAQKAATAAWKASRNEIA